MNKSDCVGCTENFYNGNNPLGVKECWHFKDAKVIQRVAISVNAPMGARANSWPEKRPQCYRARGIVHLKAIPDYAK